MSRLSRLQDAAGAAAGNCCSGLLRARVGPVGLGAMENAWTVGWRVAPLRTVAKICHLGRPWSRRVITSWRSPAL